MTAATPETTLQILNMADTKLLEMRFLIVVFLSTVKEHVHIASKSAFYMGLLILICWKAFVLNSHDLVSELFCTDFGSLTVMLW